MSDERFEAQASLVGVHVFLAVDDLDSRDLMRSVLEYAGALISVAASARAAIGALHAVRPDVLVADLSPEPDGEDGYWLVTRVRALPWAAGLPAVVVGRADRDDRRRALESGVQAHVVKPIDPWELCRLVASLGRQRG
jgi:CheY-like chemotaxis protein